MLCLNLGVGDYFVIDCKTTIQLLEMGVARCKIMIQAPKEVSVVRGEVLERSGEVRPASVVTVAPAARTALPWGPKKDAAVAAMRRTLAQMDGGSPEVRDLRRQLDALFPPQKEAKD